MSSVLVLKPKINIKAALMLNITVHVQKYLQYYNTLTSWLPGGGGLHIDGPISGEA